MPPRLNSNDEAKFALLGSLRPHTKNQYKTPKPPMHPKDLSKDSPKTAKDTPT